MDSGRILALDIGTKRTGVAISDELRMIASPRMFILTEPRDKWIAAIVNLIETEEVKELLVGIPLDQQGEVGRDARNIRTYISQLEKHLTVPITEWDESYTTVQAERSLIEGDVSRKKRKTLIDKVAASILLQSYLDHLSQQTS